MVGMNDSAFVPFTDLSTGFIPPSALDQVLRNQSVGKTCSAAFSGPRLWMVT